MKGGGGDGSSLEGGATVWTNPPVGSFDDFFSAMLLLYVMSTNDGWEETMFATMDATSPGHGPVRNDFSYASLFSILWMFVGAFFAINLFVGVIVDEFNKLKKQRDDDGGSAGVEEEGLQLVDWGLSHTTLEDVFMQLAKRRMSPRLSPWNPLFLMNS